jgi:hypothetical protein
MQRTCAIAYLRYWENVDKPESFPDTAWLRAPVLAQRRTAPWLMLASLTGMTCRQLLTVRFIAVDRQSCRSTLLSSFTFCPAASARQAAQGRGLCGGRRRGAGCVSAGVKEMSSITIVSAE